jgi:hypothetical protein
VHEFTAAGTIDLKCAYDGTDTTAASFMKITAIKVKHAYEHRLGRPSRRRVARAAVRRRSR